MCTIGYEVAMQVWVECTDSGRILVLPKKHVCKVQPPMWSRDDNVALEMFLDNLAKLNYLNNLRREAKEDAKLAAKIGNNKFIIKGLMERWTSPPDYDGKFDEVVFSRDRLRHA